MKDMLFPSIAIVALIALGFSYSAPPIKVVKIETQVALRIPYNNIRSTYSISVEMSNLSDLTKLTYDVRGTAVAIGAHTLLSAAHIPLKIAEETPGTQVKDIPFYIDIRDLDGKVVGRTKATFTKIGDYNDADLCLMEVPIDLPEYINLPNISTLSELEIGDPLYLIGAQLGLAPYNVSYGALSTKCMTVLPQCWQISALSAGGNSGGPAFNFRNHKLIGICVRTAHDYMNNNCTSIIPLKTILEFCR